MKWVLILISILGLWSLWGYFSSRVEQAKYSVLKTANGYEVREYAAHIEAQTRVDGSYREGLNMGFRIIAGYIFGGNAKKESIAMTAPVRADRGVSEPIAMTAPVLASGDGDGRIIAFVMPASYSLATLPTPTDSRVSLVEIPPKKIAALRFSWSSNTDRIKSMESRLLAMLSRDRVDIVGVPSYAGYNAPWTPPWMTRNEILVEIK